MDPVLYWNEVALEANKVSHTNGAEEQIGPTRSSRALAIVHLAMYGAYVGVRKNLATPPTLEAYLTGLPVVSGKSSAEAALAAAAHATLSNLFPSQRIFFDQKYLEFVPADTEDVNNGHAFGLMVAEKLLEARKKDLDTDKKVYVPSLGKHAHRPDPDNPKQGFLGAFYGDTDLFVLGGSALSEEKPEDKKKCENAIKNHYRLEPPPKLASYDVAVKELRYKGIAPELMGTLTKDSEVEPRSAEETLIGLFWGYDGAAGLGTPPRLYNQIVRIVAEEQGKKLKTDEERLEQNIQLFALINVAMADAGILAWREKYHHNFWRPVLGVREHDDSTGPLGNGQNKEQATLKPQCDPFWLPLGAPATNSLEASDNETQPTYPFVRETRSSPKNFTPNFPAYPSGHATFGAAALHVTRLFFGEKNLYKDEGSEKFVSENAEAVPSDKLFDGLEFISDEFNGVNKDNNGTIRPRHARKFDEGLWGMIKENGYSRVYLGVHWAFDSYQAQGGTNTIPKNIPDIDLGKNIGGVPLGLKIAEAVHEEFGSPINQPQGNTTAPEGSSST